MRHTCLILIAAFAILLAALAPTKEAGAQNEYTTPFPAFRIAQNLYYVGSKESASYLVSTPQGHILINSNL